MAISTEIERCCCWFVGPLAVTSWSFVGRTPKLSTRYAVLRGMELAENTHATTEIGAYIEIRERALVDAERTCSEATLTRVETANAFVLSCLKPARSPYQAQCLKEANAARERKRCEAVTLRVERLRSTLAHAA